MTTNDISSISSIQYGPGNMIDINRDSSGLSSMPTYYSLPPLTTHPTPPPGRICTPVSIPVIQPQQVCQGIPANSNEIPPETVDILDYTIWSRVNFVLGAFLLGIPSIILSIVTRRYKRRGEVQLAKRWSSVTLGVNIFISFVLMCAMVGLITYFNGVN